MTLVSKPRCLVKTRPKSNNLTGYRGTMPEKLDKVHTGLELAVKLVGRLKDQTGDPRFSPMDLHVRMESTRLAVKQCMITLDQMTTENWEMSVGPDPLP